MDSSSLFQIARLPKYSLFLKILKKPHTRRKSLACHLAVVEFELYGRAAVVVGVLLRAEGVGLLDVLLEHELLGTIVPIINCRSHCLHLEDIRHSCLGIWPLPQPKYQYWFVCLSLFQCLYVYLAVKMHGCLSVILAKSFSVLIWLFRIIPSPKKICNLSTSEIKVEFLL